MKLWNLISLDEARDITQKHLKKLIQVEEIDLDSAHSRILAEDIRARHPLPDFRKSKVDGYALCAKDTQAASSTIPVILDIIEEIKIGTRPQCPIQPGQASYIPTGAMVPEGADAVAMVEHSEVFGSKVSIDKSVSHMEGVLDIGEDIELGQVILEKNTPINSAGLAMLKTQAIDRVNVYKNLNIAIISTGDELVDPSEDPDLGQVRDINTYSLSSLATKLGMNIVGRQVIKDKKEDFKSAIDAYMDEADLIILSGGSSKGEGDYSQETFEQRGDLLFHGISIQPGKPTLAAYNSDKSTLLLGLPGHPMAAILVWVLLIEDSILKILGQGPPISSQAKLSTRIAGSPGRDKIIPVRLDYKDDILICQPIHSSSASISTLAGSQAYMVIPKMLEGYEKDDLVPIYYYRGEIL